MERAENTARILQVNETYARDMPSGPDWGHVLALYADRERFQDFYEESDATNVLKFYILNKDNPTSISYAVANARENARTVRHLISTEMWSQVNLFNTRIGSLGARDIQLANLSKLTDELVSACQTFEGISEGTLLRGEAWCFYHLGKYLERADQSTRILDIGYQRLSTEDIHPLSSVRWHALLRSVSGFHAFRSRHPAGCDPSDVARFFLYDTEFPRAVCLCIKRITDRIYDIEQIHGTQRDEAVEAARRSLEFFLESGPSGAYDFNELHEFLDKIQVGLGRVSLAISKSYFA